MAGSGRQCIRRQTAVAEKAGGRLMHLPKVGANDCAGILANSDYLEIPVLDKLYVKKSDTSWNQEKLSASTFSQACHEPNDVFAPFF
jgi:hypothetical protein